MKDSLSLYRLAQSSGIPILSFPLPLCGSLSIQDENFACYIGIDERFFANEPDLCVHLAHELGHCLTGSFYNRYAAQDRRGRAEHRADKWAVIHLIPRDELEKAMQEGYTEPWTLAEHFGVTEDFMRKALCWYQNGNLSPDLYPVGPV